jgi:NAD+ kinase
MTMSGWDANRNRQALPFRVGGAYSDFMSDSLLRLIVLTRGDVERVKQAGDELVQFLRSQSAVQVAAHVESEAVSLDEIPADLVLVLGGDGAILRACHQLGRHQRPILGVNLGRLGFLADLTPDEFREKFPELVQRQFRVVEHLMFECSLRRADGTVERFLGLNEAIVGAANPLQMIEVRLAINEESVTTYSCDGLIISTPVGSTAHSLSAGGPMLRQNLPAFVITPICPHTLSNRPLVDGADGIYMLSLTETSKEALLVVDGQYRCDLQVGDTVEIRRAPVTFKLAKLPGRSYYTTLQRKLGWSGQPLYPGRR